MGILDFGGRVEKDGQFTIYILRWLAKSRSQPVIPKTPTPITHASMISFSTTNPIHNQHPAVQNQENR